MFLDKRQKRARQNFGGQVFLEYTLLFGIIVAFLFALTPMIRRAAQSMVKLVADQVGNQVNAEQPGGDQGHLVNSYSLMRSDTKTRSLDILGDSQYLYDDTIRGETNVISNLGLTGGNN